MPGNGWPEPAPAPTDLRAVGERIDALLDASAAGGVVARERAEELVRLVTDLYGAGLERLLDIVHDAGALDERVLGRLADDDLVSSLLLVHGLHPYSVEDRVERALQSVRPYLGSHGGDVELLAVTPEGEVRLRLLGSCDGCPSSSVTLRLAVEGAIEAAAPEVCAIEVDAAAPGPAGATGPLIPVESLRSRLGGHDGEPRAGWHPVPGLADLPRDGLTTLEVAGAALVACRVGAEVYVFRDRCARCGAGLAGATLGRRLGGAAGDALLTCPECAAHYDVRRAGACADTPDLHLEPLPVIADDAGVSVALPAEVVA